MNLFRKLHTFFLKQKLETEMAEEMRHHVELQTALNLKAGMNPDEARYAALRQFGNVSSIQEQAREVHGWVRLEQLGQDLRFAVRMLRKHPGYAVITVLTLAIGVGLSTAVVSAADAMLHRKVAFREVDRLAWIYAHNSANRPARERISPDDLKSLATSVTALESVAAIGDWSLTWHGGSRPSTWQGLLVAQDLATVLGVQPVLGRTFTAGDFAGNAGNLIMLGFERWQTDFGSDPTVLGRRLEFGDENFIVIGVLPAGLEFPLGLPPQSGNGNGFRSGPQDFWLTRKITAESAGHERGLTGIARLRSDTNLAAAQQEADTLGRHLAGVFPKTHRDWSFSVVPLREQMLGQTARALPVLLGAVAVMLLIASANVAHLVLSRAVSREKEFAVRAALGGGRLRLIRQVLVENMLLAALGGGLGALVAVWVLAVASAADVPAIPFLQEVRWNGRTLVWCAGLTAASGLLFSIGPLAMLWRRKIEHALHLTVQGNVTDRGTKRLRQGLVVTQIALALTLVIGATLLLKSFGRLMRVDTGYDAIHVIAADVVPPPAANLSVWFSAVAEQIRALPGVEAVGTVHSVPLTAKWVFQESIFIEGADPAKSGATLASGSFVSANYFEAMGTRLVTGRAFTAAEVASEGDAPAIILNQTAARRFFPPGNALGQRVRVPAGRSREVVGIVQDTLDQALDSPVAPQFYLPAIFGGAQLIVRTNLPAENTVETVRAALLAADSQMMVNSVEPLSRVVAASVAARRLTAALLTAFSGIAFGLMLVGLYGVLEFSVVQRTKEFGIRQALGAQAADVRRLVLGEGMRLVVFGIGLGGVGAVMIARALRPLLFRVGEMDALSYLFALVLLIITGVLAGWLPARRAAKVDPVVALRAE